MVWFVANLAGSAAIAEESRPRRHYLHHDGHSERIFSNVLLAFLARRTATFSIFGFVKLVFV